ncbi:MAG TPA: hydroxyacid dehydrogenase [Chloroflexaceae bacterium]|nr:hydroxyacid dehydrogenase [Chloroflexaceae bacterium]
MRVVISELIWEPALEPLRAAGAEPVYAADLWRRPDDLRAALAGAEALVVRNQTRVTGDLLAAAPRLKVVGRLGVGLDNIDLAAARERSVQVVFARSSNAVAVAEYVFAAMFEAARRLAAATADVRAGGWDRQGFTGSELYGKTLGIVGLGDIGGRLARRAQAFGMRIVASDPQVTTSSPTVAEYGVALLPLDRLLAESDFVSLHVPLVPATAGMINAERLALMKPTAWLINTARGGVIDEAALADALRAGRLGGAALDVRASEPPGPDDPLAGAPNLVLSPHIAGITAESHERTATMVVDDVLRVLGGRAPLNPA